MIYRRIIGGLPVTTRRQSGVKRVIYLNSVGAHLEKGSGILIGHYHGEAIMGELARVAISFMRPVGFYYNLYGFVPMIKTEGIIAANWGAAGTLVWVSPVDIAAAIVDELETPPIDRKIRYVVSDERTGNGTARILGAAIGKPDLTWTIISGEQMRQGLEAAGMNPAIAANNQS